MSNKWSYDRVHGISTLIADCEYDPTEEMPPFVIEGVLHRSLTLVVGPPEAGKSTFGRAMLAAIANGESDFIGRPIAAPGLSCAVIAADPDSAYEYAEEFRTLLSPGVQIPIHCPDLPVAIDTWQELHSLASRNGYRVILVDNLTQFTPGGDLESTAAVQELMNRLRWFDMNHVAVALIAHASKNNFTSSHALGITTIHAGPRWACRITGTGDVRKLAFSGNPGAGKAWATHTRVTSSGRLECVNGPADCGGDGRKRQRGGKRRAKSDQIRDYVLSECQPYNGKDTGARIKARFGGAASTHASNLSRGVYGVKRNGNRWVPVLRAA